MKIPIYLISSLILIFSSCRKPHDGDSNSSNNNNNTTLDSVYFFDSSSGVFNYNLYSPLSDKPCKIHFYIPDFVNRSVAPILFIFPGANRNADDYLETWVPIADDKGLMIFSFEFSTNYYSSYEYQQGNIVDQNNNINNDSIWTFSLIEPVFDIIKSQLNYQLNSYNMYGHSAGAQFVHRYVLFISNARINRAVAANSGWYTVPDKSVLYPYGLDNSSLNINQIHTAFSQNLEIHLGQNDNNPNDPYLRVTPEANLQGLHRLERGRYFFNQSEFLSLEYNSPSFNWVKKEVPNVGHSNDEMAIFAANELF